ncbi:hypothetical protein DOJK_00610 [Patescibacteria group bacterium]|nr:hypothetical protein DOJK_00610 [Patescibacteria group bacterium]
MNIENCLKKHQVSSIILVHGTFAGNDALGLFDLLEPLSKQLADILKQHGKALLDKIAGDVGNYTPEYATSMSQLTNIPCELFIWSSGNYHLARLHGALKLAQTLANNIIQHHLQGKPILLMGHSHAGQVFALLTRFLSDDAEDIYAIMAQDEELNRAKTHLLEQLKIIKTVQLDIVTFGTPVRYAWGNYQNYRLLAIVNHRSDSTVSGILSTRDGDYVQHWGITGTDAFPPNNLSLNDAFDSVLDEGRNLTYLAQQSSTRQKNPAGDNLFLDYQDNAPMPIDLLDPLNLTHCIKTLFGHGVYTQLDKMQFNLNTIIQHWYS